VPTRGRPENMARLAASFVGTNAQADLYAVLTKDDPEFDKYLDNKNYMCLVSDNYTGGCARPLNDGAKLLLDSSVFPFYDIFIFMGDDHLPQTLEWDLSLQKALMGKTGIAYGNDLLQGQNLPTQWAMTRDIVERLQGMAPPGIKHLYIDDFAKQLGIDLNCLIYLPEVIIEHLHPLANKAEWDEGYKRVNQDAWYTEDLLAMQTYLRSSEYADLVNALK
jgi:hypothetical protein